MYTQYVVAVKNSVTGERHVFTQGINPERYDGDTNRAWAEFHKSIRVMISHKNRLKMKLGDCKYSYVEATDSNVEKAYAWERSITVEQYRKEASQASEDMSWAIC